MRSRGRRRDRDPAPDNTAVVEHAEDERAAPTRDLSDLQSSIGNAAVTTLVQRLPSGGAAAAPAAPATPSPRAVPRANVTAARLSQMTLGELDQLSRDQVDWRSSPDVQALPDGGDEYRDLLQWAQSSSILAVCEGDSARQLLDAMAATPSFRRHLGDYADAVQRNGWIPASSTADTISWATAHGTIRGVLSEPITDLVVKQNQAATNLSALVRAGAVQDFCDFVSNTSPQLSANNGMEITSYLRLRAEGDPLSYANRIPHLRNLHHFEKGALDALAANAADTSRAKPLVLVLHSAIDHNGAFHRDPNMTAVVRHRRNNTLMVEGAGTLSGAGQAVGDLTQRYGQGTPPKAEQIMLAGHGNARVTELAGDIDPHTAEITEEAVDLDAADTTDVLALIDTLFDNLSSDPNARIVLNGCLTASNVTNARFTDDPSNRAGVVQQVRNALQANRSLADTIRDIGVRNGYAPGQVSGATSSFGSEVSLINRQTGRLGLRSPDDPEMTNADKFRYVSRAGEATGALRAAVECIAADPTRADTAMRSRIGRRMGRTDWDDSIIRAFFRLIRPRIDDIAFANDLSLIAGSLSEAQWFSECKPGHFHGESDTLLTTALTPLASDPQLRREPHLALLIQQLLLRSDTGRAQPFLAAMSGFSVNSLQEIFDPRFVQAHLTALLPAAPGRNSGGELRLALFDVVANGSSAHTSSVAYLRQRRTGDAFTNPNAIRTALGGAASVSSVLDSIREPSATANQPQPSGSPPAPVPDFNVDIDGDGTNDAYVTPMVKYGIVIGTAVLRDRPAPNASVVATLPDNQQLKIIGATTDGLFYVVEWGPGNEPQFVERSNVLAL